MNDYPVYESTIECAKCKGQCCRKMPGHYSPSDFADLSFEALKAEIERGGIAIDWWVAEPEEYYLRARQLGEGVVHGSWGGICVNLTPCGCRLSWDERPLGCKSLKPKETPNGDCLGSYSKEQCKNDWKQYDTVLRELVAHFGEQVDSMEENFDSLMEAMKWLMK